MILEMTKNNFVFYQDKIYKKQPSTFGVRAVSF